MPIPEAHLMAVASMTASFLTGLWPEGKKMEKQKKGFNVLTPEQRIEIARLGGLAAQATGRAHKFTPAEAREAGRKGGLAPRTKRRIESSPIVPHKG
jgi:general stress protein YciG